MQPAPGCSYQPCCRGARACGVSLTCRFNRKLTLGEARTLLERAPALRTLGLDGMLRITLPALKLLSEAGVTAQVHVPDSEGDLEPED